MNGFSINKRVVGFGYGLAFVCLLTLPGWAQLRPRLVQSWASKPGLNLTANQLQADQNGTFWLATDHGLIRKQKNTFRVFRGAPKNVGDDYLWMTLTPDGQPWLYGGPHKPLVYLDMTHNRLITLPDSSRIVREVILRYGCESLFADATGAIWIGTQHRGAVRYDPRSQTVEHQLDEAISITGMGHDGAKRIWFVAHLHGLRCYDPRTNQWRIYPVGPTKTNAGEPDGLPTEGVNRMHVRRNGRILLGLRDQLVEFDPVTERCRRWRFHPHLSNPRYLASHFQEDTAGNLYFDVGTVTYQLAANGTLAQLMLDMPTAPVSALLLDKQGFLWVNTPNHLSCYDVRAMETVAMPVLLDVVINGKLLEANTKAYQFDWPKTGMPTLSLPEGENLTLHVSPGALRKSYSYRTRLTGLETDWTLWINNTAALHYTLPAGQYRLDVETNSDKSGRFAQTQTLLLTVRPPVWRTPYALSLGAFVVLGLLGWGFRAWQRRQQLKRSMEKQAIEATFQRQLNQFKTSLFANITHEFRTPLTLILNSTERLTTHTADQTVQRAVTQIEQNAHQLLRLVEELMDVARSDAGKLTRHDTVGQPALVIAQTVETMRILAEKKAIALRLETIGNAETSFLFDSDKLSKITHNLLSNALKFTPTGGRVAVTATISETNGLTLTISDTGIGIAPHDQERVFERFYQQSAGAVSANGIYEGTGLGLSFVREMVQLLGGTVTVESQVGQGSTFTVQLPMGVAAPVTFPEKTDLLLTDSEKPLLLLVEDNDMLRLHLSEDLCANYQILLASDGQQGLRIALEHVPDLIVSDVMMPGRCADAMDGFALLEKLKTDERTSHIPVILLTARASLDSRLQGLAAGADDYLSKPFSVAELHYRIRNALQTRLNWQQHLQRLTTESRSDTPVVAADMNPVPVREQQFVARLKSLILSHLTDDIDTQWLLNQTRLSRTQLHRKLTALTGQSVTHFVNQVRLEKARELLERGDGNVSEVAFRVGFKSPSYFTKLFTAEFGETPGQVKA